MQITDFGLSRLMDSETYQASADTTFPVRWTALETLTLRLISRASDVWSFAVTIWEIIEGKLPYPDLVNSQVAGYLSSGKRLPRPTAVIIPDELWSLMQRCWAKAPEERPTFDAICTELKEIQNRYYRGNNSNNDKSIPEDNSSNTSKDSKSISDQPTYNTSSSQITAENYN